MRWSQQLWCQGGVTLAILPFFKLFLTTGHRSEKHGQKGNTEHTRGIGYAYLLLQSPLTAIPGFTPYTAFIPQGVATTCRFLHDTTLSCLPIDWDSDAVAAHDDNSTDVYLLPARPVDIS